MRARFLLLIAALFCIFSQATLVFAQTQAPPVAWTEMYGSSGSAFGTAVAVDSNGVYMVGGGPTFIAKYDFQGTLLWSHDLGVALDGGANYSVATDSSGVYVVGSWDGGRVAKYDTNGNLLWQKLINEFPGGMALDSTGVFVDTQIAIHKYDLNGNELWTHGVANNGSGNEQVAVDASGFYVSSFGGPIAKYDFSGNQIWTVPNPGCLLSMKVDATGIYVGGYISFLALPGQNYIGGNADAILIKYDLNGDQLWAKEFGTDQEDLVEGIFVDSTGVYVAGRTSGSLPGYINLGNRDAFVRKYTSEGVEVWTRQFGTNIYDDLLGIAKDEAGDIYVTGFYSDWPVLPYFAYATLTKLSSPDVAPIAAIAQLQPVVLGEPMLLDGSTSYDSDGSIVSYSWDFGDGLTGVGSIISHTYETAGTYKVSLAVTDDGGLTGTTTATAIVQTPSQAINSIVQTVQAMNLAQGFANSLDTKLQNAINALDSANSGNRADAVNKLYAFINATQAQSGSKLTAEQANQLIAFANRIIVTLQ